MSRVVLLGPQRFEPNVKSALDDLDVRGPVAVVTAGWQEREPEEDELGEHLRRPVMNVALYLRAEQAFARDPDLFDAIRKKQRRLRRLQRLYRLRLDHQLDAARDLLARKDDPELLGPEQESAIAAVHELDAHHERRIREIHEDFDRTWNPTSRPEIAMHREAIAEIFRRTEALLIAGGHVAVLLNRLRMFGVLELVEERPLVAWSAGAMALSERVILFHDSPPQGAGNAELFDIGLGVAPGLIPLPHASSRLRLEDRIRVSLLARRFAPARPVPLERHTRLTWDGSRWHPASNVTELDPSGEVLEVAAS